LKFEISNTNVQLIKNSITGHHKNQERKKKKNRGDDYWKKKAPRPYGISLQN